MIRAHQLLFAERGPAVRLIVVGDGPLRRVYERMVSDEARPYVHFAGRLNRSRPNYLVTGDVFCTPCDRASFGMVLLEAMSCGRPVAASRISGFQLLMEDGRQGFLVQPGAVAGALRRRACARCWTTTRCATRMAAEGRRTALEQLLLADGDAPPRDVLHRPDRGATTGMGKRQVLTRFVALSIVWCLIWGTVAVKVGDERRRRDLRRRADRRCSRSPGARSRPTPRCSAR